MVGIQREVAYGITASDQASKVFQDAQNVVTQGARSINDAVNQATASSEKFAKSQEKLRDWVRENRQEQRMYAGVLNEVRDAVGLSGIALAAFGMAAGEAEGAAKTLSVAVNQGYAAFQGLDALIGVTGLAGGPWGLAIAAIGGVAAAMLSLFRETPKATEKIEDQSKALDEIIGKYDKWQSKLKGSAEANRAVSEAEAGLLRARLGVLNQIIAAQEEGTTQLDIVVDTSGKSAAELAAIQDQITRSTGQSLEANRKMADEIQTSLQAVSMAAKEVVTNVGAIRQLDWPADFLQPAGMQTVLLTMNDIERQMGEDIPKAYAKASASAQKASKIMIDTAGSVSKDLEERAKLMETIFSAALGTLRTGFEEAFSGSEAAGRKFLKALLLTVIDTVQAMILAAAAIYWAKGVITFGFSFVADTASLIAASVGLQLLRAFVATKFHQGGIVPRLGSMYAEGARSQEFPILVRGGETIRTEEQEAELRRGVGSTIVVNINAPIDRMEWIKEGVEEGLRRTGLTANEFFVNQRGQIALGSV